MISIQSVECFYPIYSVFSMLSNMFSVCLHKIACFPSLRFFFFFSYIFSSSTSPKEEINLYPLPVELTTKCFFVFFLS